MESLVFNMTKFERIKGFYTALFKRYGSQGWWPAETELECILGTILTQNTSWKSVEKALKNLKSKGLTSIEKLSSVPIHVLAELIRPSGYFNQKAIKIKNFIKFLNENYDGRLERMFKEDPKKLREKLLGIKGIGPETAYSILSRHALIPEDSDYREIQEVFMDVLPKDTQLFNEYHALLVKVGKEHCKKKPICNGCPLEYDPHTV